METGVAESVGEGEEYGRWEMEDRGVGIWWGGRIGDSWGGAFWCVIGDCCDSQRMQRATANNKTNDNIDTATNTTTTALLQLRTPTPFLSLFLFIIYLSLSLPCLSLLLLLLLHRPLISRLISRHRLPATTPTNTHTHTHRILSFSLSRSVITPASCPPPPSPNALLSTMSDAVLIDIHHPPTSRPPNYAAVPPPPPPAAHPFRQHALWSACALLFSAYLAVVLYLFLTNPVFRHFVVTRANTLFALPYILSLLVVLLCLAPFSPTPARTQLDPAITNPADCCLVLLVLLEWATCLALVLITLISVHDGLSYVTPDGLILPVVGSVPPDAKPADGISDDALVVLIIPLLLMYTLFNFLIHFYSSLEAAVRISRNLPDNQ